ncbi:MAG: hypothetical protein VKI42_02845 [Synechococcaceae cyanobacterium]|nr:hypothetical protein [Synechococcaceae cyanobacterium]
MCWIQLAPHPLVILEVLSQCIREAMPAGGRSSGKHQPCPEYRLDRSFLPLMPFLASIWISQADAVYAVVSTAMLLAVVLLVLRPGDR